MKKATGESALFVSVRVSPKGIPKKHVACLFIVLALASCSFVVNGIWEVMCLKGSFCPE